MLTRVKQVNLASSSLIRQIWGALLEHWLFLCLLIIMVLIPLIIFWFSADTANHIIQNFYYQLSFLTLFSLTAILSCRTLSDIFSLRKMEPNITWCQISILLAIGLWIIGFVIIFNAKSHPDYATALAITGTLAAWFFQDTIKGVVAFIHLRVNHQLYIGDWIQVPKYNVNGIVSRVSLTNVTIYNWDTTTSTIPTSMLHSDHFINLQNMRAGKTYGRRMLRTFILDTGWFHLMTAEEVDLLRQNEDVVHYLPKEEIKEDIMNAKLFRLYLFHWLMNHPHISQEPRLIVRWMEQTEAGMPLQVYAFITETVSSSFEWQQSQIIEHIIKSIDLFGLRLYQAPSNYDVSNCNIHLTRKRAIYRKEAEL